MKCLRVAVHATIMIISFFGLARGKAPLSCRDSAAHLAIASRDAFYCQDPDFIMIYNMSSGFEAEIADDIPVEWVGYSVASITLWFGEWYTGGGQGWQDPVGLRVNFYQESCPPELVPYRSIEIAWDDLDKILVDSSSSRWVYEVHVPLSPALVVESGMSLGATALIDWGQEEPFCGIVATPFWVSYGACPAYLDGENWGYIRWTAIDEFTTINQDLAYCLETGPTEVPAAGLGTFGLSAWPNPFNPQTTISFSLDRAGWAEVGVYELTGRRATTLADRTFLAGTHALTWDGRDFQGRALPSGNYLVRLETDSGAEARKVMLVR